MVSALFAASAAHNQAPATAPDRSPEPIATRATSQHPAAAVVQANFVPQTHFAQIAEVVAKRYRVSSQATLDLVRTAYREANRNGLDPVLILAVVAIESRFNPIAQSDQGAMGLMQIVPRFHEDKLARRDGSVLDPQVNIEVGTQLLREYISRAGTEAAGLQLYNGSADDPAAAYATKVMSERDRLRHAIRRAVGNRA
jgi:soluble lytic murein transglycosylase-like protein